ncbi:unnamed protein product [Gongylonema pulchrum]|uniref:Piwi domain-containing protein n=1 Tax=Gongylonema pulchrum TaxID=637853 RepID=A0A3P6RD99_9BILA|nr:unnamed protein product [Gongylonema pulchrum]
MQALDLDNSRRFNPFMAAFGVRVSSTPLTVEGHRRGAPQVIYSDAGGRGGIINIDSRNANWRMTGKEYLIVAQLSCWFILYDEQKDEKMVLTFTDCLLRECRKRGIRMVDPIIKNVAFEDLENSFKQIRDMYRNQQPFVIYVDSRDGTHGFFFYA